MLFTWATAMAADSDAAMIGANLGIMFLANDLRIYEKSALKAQLMIFFVGA